MDHRRRLRGWVIAFPLGSAIGILRTLDRPIWVVVPVVKSPIYFRTRAIGTSKGIIWINVGWFLHGFSNIYVTIFRNVPLLVQLFLWYFVFPELLSDEAGAVDKAGTAVAGVLDGGGLSRPLYRLAGG